MQRHHKLIAWASYGGFRLILTTSGVSAVAQVFHCVFIFQDFAVPRTRKSIPWTRSGENPRFWCSWDSKNSKITDVGAFPAPPNPKTMRETNYQHYFSHDEKIYFFENHFFAIFLGFFDSSKQGFSRSGRPGDVSVPRPTGPKSVPGYPRKQK